MITESWIPEPFARFSIDLSAQLARTRTPAAASRLPDAAALRERRSPTRS